MAEDATLSDCQTNDGNQTERIAAYRHEAHKMNGQPHGCAPKTLAGVPVNQTVPYGAYGDALSLSCPSGQIEQTRENHETLYRHPLTTGESRYNPEDLRAMVWRVLSATS